MDTVVGSVMDNLKELRPGSATGSEVRVLFAFDPWRSAILLVAGDKSGRWKSGYRDAVPEAERLYRDHLQEREGEGA
ncbi:type II toxin-antitoxin system RelE/ParE family toxin [Nocardiopsis listeri]|uniref:type II toxin-antitoxin system RelE/ParE family toxin n=1 Tax=Nocardiopsis listeri TaxID=53440 RepID=UPI0021DFB512|nr:type II toxin-antitoxin system RelE/ParE family toxin [Nocardiopsis listeri]